MEVNSVAGALVYATKKTIPLALVIGNESSIVFLCRGVLRGIAGLHLHIVLGDIRTGADVMYHH